MPADTTAPAARLTANLRGIVWMAGSTVAFVIMHATVRHVSKELNPIEIAFFRQAFGFLALTPFFLRYGLTPFRTTRLRLHTARAAINTVAMLSFYYALSTTPLAEVSALAFSSPIFATLLAMLFLGERVRLRRWMAILVGFAGTFVVIRPGFESVGPGQIAVLLSSATWAVALILIKLLGRTESSLTITAYMTLLMTPMSLFPAIAVWQWPTAETLAWLALIGIAGTTGQMLVTQALKEGDTSVVMPIDFLKLIWAASLGFLWFGEVPTIFTWTGGAMIFASTTYIAVREHQLRSAGRTVTVN